MKKGRDKSSTTKRSFEFYTDVLKFGAALAAVVIELLKLFKELF